MAGAALLLALALSAPGPFTLVNGTGTTITSLSIRAADGRGNWRALGGPFVARQRSPMPAPGGDLCAFDLRARVDGAEFTWSSVNLCDVRSVTLNRRPDGTLWVDYD
ncbi:hypothetical protein V6R86_12125 [Sphingomonas kaistensis]|uniref:Uncharacterized protein n=1 Tax=Sphingomonas kaistensis TaxID=298708 RepID=A0ABZ2G342_9SPHN